MKRCKGCKWLFDENFESIVGYSCCKGATIPRFKLQEMESCKHYNPKWNIRLMFWRSK